MWLNIGTWVARLYMTLLQSYQCDPEIVEDPLFTDYADFRTVFSRLGKSRSLLLPNSDSFLHDPAENKKKWPWSQANAVACRVSRSDGADQRFPPMEWTSPQRKPRPAFGVLPMTLALASHWQRSADVVKWWCAGEEARGSCGSSPSLDALFRA